MSKNQIKKDVSTRTRRGIIDLLKEQGGMDVVALSSQFSLSGMAIRQHLNALKEEGLVMNVEESRPMGRPAKLWVLTPAANRFSQVAIQIYPSALFIRSKKLLAMKGWINCWMFEIKICKNNIFSILAIHQIFGRNWRN